MAKGKLRKVVSSLLTCTYVCLAFMYEWTHVYTCTREWGDIRLIWGAFPHLSPPYKLRKALPLSLELAVLASLVGGLTQKFLAATELQGTKL